MDATPIEIVEMVVEMFRKHQELCPHRMEWITTSENLSTHVKEVKYRCKVCGKEETVIMNEMDEP